MKDAAPQVPPTAAGVSVTGHRATMIDVPIVSPRKALPHSPYDKSHTPICRPETSPFATEAIASATPAPMNGGRTTVMLGADCTSDGGTSPIDVTCPTTTTGAVWTLCWKVAVPTHEQAYAGSSFAPSNTKAARHVHENRAMTSVLPPDWRQIRVVDCPVRRAVQRRLTACTAWDPTSTRSAPCGSACSSRTPG